MRVLITTDTEMSSSLHKAGLSPAENYALAIEGKCEGGAFGIAHQMDRLEAHGLKGVFFVDPMPGLVYGRQIVADMVGPIVARGHEVQLHLHTEWLDHAVEQPVGKARGKNIGDFSYADQLTLLELARDMLIGGGAPAPTAFRAGNFGANDNTLRALAAIGMTYDSSYNPAYADKGCDISLPPGRHCATRKHGVVVIPVSTIAVPGGALRPAQICALSAEEMGEALDHAAASRADFFNIVSHSFELIVRDTRLPNAILIDRFEKMCERIAENPDLESAGFADLSGEDRAARPLPPRRRRTLRRLGQQAVSKILYEGAGPLPPVAALNPLK